MITDLSGVIEYVNPKFCEVTGYGLEEVYGKTPRMLRSVSASPEIYQELWATITAGRKWQGRFQNRKKNGDLFWESAIISPILDGHGVITQYMGIISKNGGSETYPHDQPRLSSRARLATRIDMGGI
jgi:PAS domain S-box-containing protein